MLIVVYDVNIYTNCIDTQRDGFDKVYKRFFCFYKDTNTSKVSVDTAF